MSALPVVPDWFRVTRIDDSLTLLEEPYADPWIAANMWHLRGRDLDLLIDTGLGIASLKTTLKDLFAEREPVAVVTHAHLDHLGSAHEFAQCWAHELEPTTALGQGTLSGPELIEILGAEDVAFDPPGDTMVTALPYEGYDWTSYELRPVEPTRRLVDGDRIDLGDRSFTVLHLPGHTPGSIGLHDVENRTLFTGDVIYDPPALLDGLHGSNAEDYVASLRRLLTLDVVRVYAGHGDSFDGVRLRELIGEYLRDVESRASRTS